MRRIALCLLLAGCASEPQDLRSFSTAELCYRGALHAEDRRAAAEEVARRQDDCAKHTAEIEQLRDNDLRAVQMGGGAGVRQGGMGGGMGRGY